MFSNTLICKIAASLLTLAVATTASAQQVRLQALNLDEIGELRIVEGKITGNESVDYPVEGKRSQILSVDLLTSNPASYFNILPADSQDAIFTGSTHGIVADVTLQATHGAVTEERSDEASASRYRPSPRYLDTPTQPMLEIIS